MTAQRLLVIACTKRKKTDVGELPALYRYDGPSFRVLRKYIDRNPEDAGQLDIFVLSAHYRLIDASTKISYYDTLMDNERANSMRDEVTASLTKQITYKSYNSICIALSKKYSQAVGDLSHLATPVSRIQAPQGEFLALLKKWLWRVSSSDTDERHTLNANRKRGMTTLRGVPIHYSINDVWSVVEKKISSEHPGMYNYRNWYVEFKGHRLSPKWIVSNLTGIPVGRFTAGEARRVLHQIGISCRKLEN